jgi:hypothetical protein
MNLDDPFSQEVLSLKSESKLRIKTETILHFKEHVFTYDSLEITPEISE